MRQSIALLVSLILLWPSYSFAKDQTEPPPSETSLLDALDAASTETKPTRVDETTAWESRSTGAEKWFFKDMPRHIGNDFVYTFWNPWHMLFLAGGVGATLGIHQADDAIRDSFQANHPLGGAADVFNIMGNPIVLGGASLVSLGIAKLVHAPKVSLTAGTMFESFFITEVLTTGLKYATQRERPDGSDNHSFPSGHVSGSFALATVTEIFYGPLYGVPAYALASLVALSRIDANKHWASDTAAGAVLGTLIGLGTAKFHKKEFSKYFIVPTIDEKSAGLALIHPF
jgi:membrane-associated phospholipid phosphatase